ncbi:MAG: HNH endonuclease [Ilumatobacteraceae bacterium]
MLDLSALTATFSRLVSAAVTDDVAERDREQVTALVRDAARLNAFVESVRLDAVHRLQALADASGTFDAADTLRPHVGTKEARRTASRAATASQVPQLRDALAEGAVSTGHVDAVTQALSRLEPADRARLASEGDWIASVASRCTPDELERALRQRARQLATDDGVARFERQRRATTLRHWVDKDTGMTCIYGEFDPESGAKLVTQLQAAVERLFHDALPDSCPTDDRKQGHLRALALLDLVSRPASAGGRAVPEMIVVVDHDTLRAGLHAHSRIDISGDVELPVSSLRRLACQASIIPVVLGGDGVVLDVGRERRLATVHQRRALRAMYSTCIIWGCGVGFDHCEMHHLRPWEDGGPSDLDNFAPLCNGHHHAVHEGGWMLHLDPVDRTLTVTKPDGTTTSHPPPLRRTA